MKTFDYVTILFSILLGVCITQMATNIVLVIQNFSTSVLYGPPILWNATALLAILAHWVHFYKARGREHWSALQLTIVFVTPLIYLIPATLIAQAPRIDGMLNYELVFEANKKLIYCNVFLFALFTMGQYYFVYDSRERFVFIYYSTVIGLTAAALILDARLFDQGLAVTVFISEFLNHYVIRPLKLP